VEKYSKVGQAIDDNKAHAHCMLENKISDYLVVTAFPQQQCLRKRDSVLRYMYIAYLLNYFKEQTLLLLFNQHYIIFMYIVLNKTCKILNC
jgi:hypothetical protein